MRITLEKLNKLTASKYRLEKLEKLKELTAGKYSLEYFKTKHGQEADLDEVLDKLRKDKTTTDFIFWLFEKLKLSGVAEQWYENGQFCKRYNYKNGKLHGVAEWWHENGQICRRSNYKNGVSHGAVEWWDENGRVAACYIFKNGLLVD